MFKENKIGFAREAKSFADFRITEAGQQPVVDTLMKIGERIVENAQQIASSESPFPYGGMLIVWSPTRRGKTHLLKALARQIIEGAPLLENKVYLGRDEPDWEGESGPYVYDGCPIVLLDDLLDLRGRDTKNNEETINHQLLKHIGSFAHGKQLIIATLTNEIPTSDDNVRRFLRQVPGYDWFPSSHMGLVSMQLPGPLFLGAAKWGLA